MLELFKRTNELKKNPIAGYNIKHFVIEIDELDYLSPEEQGQLVGLMEKVNIRRKSEGKPEKLHLVIESDKEYVEQVVKVMKSNKDWGN